MRKLVQLCTLLVLSSPAFAALTTIADVLHRADGSTCSGSLFVSWTTFMSVSNQLIFAGSIQSPVTNGAVNVSLEPGTYRVGYNVGPVACTPTNETWVVPVSSTPLTIAGVRSLNPPPPGTSIALTFLASGGAVSGQCLLFSGTIWGPGACGPWTVSGNDIFNSNSGNVGIGAAPGAFKLDITGTQRVSGNLTSNGTNIKVDNATPSFNVSQGGVGRTTFFANAAGTLMEIGRYDDSGNYLDDYLTGTRSNGALLVPSGHSFSINALAGAGTKCVHANNTGLLSLAVADCGSGGGATIPSVTNLIKGDGTGNGADTKVAVTSPTTAAILAFPVDNATIAFQGTDTYLGRTTTDTLTNKTYDTAGAGNSFSINGNAVTAVEGNTAKVALFSGADPAANDCAKFDANHNLVTNGASCAGGNGITIFKTTGNPIVDLTNSNMETTLWSQAITGLGTAGELHVSLLMLLLNTSGSQTITFRIKLGATTLITHTVTNGANANPDPGQLIIDVANRGVTNAQYTSSRYIQGGGTASGSASSVLGGIYQEGTNSTSTVDMTTNPNLVITAQWTNAVMTTDLKFYAGRIEQY